jgi:menaquinone-dependent protoporphyrinogen IX oxidase
MERRRIDCPETEKREQIDFERTPCGVVITECSRFEPRCALACSARCAALLDRRDRRDVDDIDPRVLVVYDGRYGRTTAIADGLSAHLSCDRVTVELADAGACAAPPPADYDAVVIGSSVVRGDHPRSIVEYIANHRDALAAMPVFFFTVGHDDDLHRLWRTTGWLPNATAVFDTPATPRGIWNRFVAWLRRRTPSPADTRFAYSTRVRDFALKIAQELPDPGLAVTMRPARKRIESR